MQAQIFFKEIVLEGFGSFQKKTAFPLNQVGINLVYGENGNGKTTLFSALLWCLYKVNLKGTNNDKVATWQSRRLKDYKGTRVAVSFSVGEDEYLIIRHLDYKGKTLGVVGASQLMILQNGVELGSEQHKNDQQAYIQRLIGLESKTFLHSVLFGQRMKRLIEADNKEKRELLETLFDLGFVADAKAKATLKIAALEKQLQTTNTSLKDVDFKITTIVDRLNARKKQEEDFESEKDKAVNTQSIFIDSLKEQIQTAQEKFNALCATVTQVIDNKELLEKYTEAATEFDRVSKNLTADERLISDYEYEIQKAEKRVEEANKRLEGIKDTCPTCGEKFKDVSHIKTAKKLILEEITAEAKIISDFKLKVVPVKERVDACIKDLALLRIERDEKKVELDKLAVLKKEASANETAFSDAKSDVKVLEERLDNAYLKLNDIETAVLPAFDHVTEHSNLAAWEVENEKLTNQHISFTSAIAKYKWWGDKAFSASGLKAFVFEAMLGRLNEYVEKYASRLGVSVNFGVDLTKTSKPFLTTCYKDGIQVDYEELSGGEKQRIDICMSFALHDLITHTSNINLLILDEACENLDQRGIEVIFDLIAMKAGGNKAVYLITHQLAVDTSNAKSFTILLDEDLSSYID